ncbi:MAG: PQQ-binding-like beta-propeller repeat protein [Pirellulales bacterium]
MMNNRNTLSAQCSIRPALRWLPLALVTLGLLSGCRNQERSPADAPDEQPAATAGDAASSVDAAKETSSPTSPANQPAAWPLFRGNPAGTGVADGRLPEKLELVWKFKPDAERSSFQTTAAIVNGMVFIGDAHEKLYALDLANGEVKWSASAELGFIAPPAVDDGRVFVGGGDNVFYCFDAATGDELWRYEAGGEINAGANFYQETVLFAAQDGNLSRLNKENGEVVWQFNIQAEGGIQCMPTLGGSHVFFAGCDGLFHVLSITDGEDLAAVDIGGPSLSSPAIRDEVAYLGTEDGNVLAVNWQKPEVVWTYRSERGNQAYRSSAAVDNDVIIVAGRDKMVRALRPADGEPLWQFAARARIDSSPVIVDERVFVGASDGRVYGLDKTSGELVWQYDAGGDFIASVAVAEGKLVIGNDDGTVYCFGEQNN